MTTQQPDWELIGNLGDRNVADYGGFLVYRDKTGVYRPEVELYEPLDEGKEEGGQMYRFILEPPRFKTFIDGQWDRDKLSDPKAKGTVWRWHKEWFIDKLPEIASYTGTTACYLIRCLASKRAIDNAQAYRDIVAYCGPGEFDSYPVTLTEEEAQARYADIKDY